MEGIYKELNSKILNKLKRNYMNPALDRMLVHDIFFNFILFWEKILGIYNSNFVQFFIVTYFYIHHS